MLLMSEVPTGGAMTPMPQYQCHKIVWALKIKEIDPAPRPTVEELDKMLNDNDGASYGDDKLLGAMITPEEEGYAPFPVSMEYVRKHKPQVGGYYVVYEDGYKSWSPAKAFEDGYTRK